MSVRLWVMLGVVSLLLVVGRFSLIRKHHPGPRIAQLNQEKYAVWDDREWSKLKRIYDEMTALEPARPATPDEVTSAEALCPNFRWNREEFFSLRRFVVVIHPTEPVIAYHLGIDGDIDAPPPQRADFRAFAFDNEVAWVWYDPETTRPTRAVLHYHGALLTTELDGKPPEVAIEWGKHGLLPQSDRFSMPLTALIRKRWDWWRLRYYGRKYPRRKDNREWPDRFSGDWAAFDDFSIPVNLKEAIVRQPENVVVSRWESLAIYQVTNSFFFRPRVEWPAGTTGN